MTHITQSLCAYLTSIKLISFVFISLVFVIVAVWGRYSNILTSNTWLYATFYTRTIPLGPTATTHANWIVVTTINSPTSTIKKLATLDGWKVVVIGDTKTPSGWTYPNVTFLSVDDQLVLGLSITKLVPLKTYARKNIGYLYAIQKGANRIYETDDDNELLYDNIQFVPPKLSYITTEKVVNPYAYFGQPSVWPRGYPLDFIANTSSIVIESTVTKSFVNQGLANGDPDVDAIYRLTRTVHGQKIRIKFEDRAAVAIPVGTFVPYNSQNTLIHREALWSLLIPITTTFRICDIWRSYWAQRLMWEIGGQISFHKPSVFQDRNIHSYYEDFLDENDMYRKTSHLINFLSAWTSDKPTFFGRVQELSNAMVVNKYWGQGDADLTRAWLADLTNMGYVEPTLLNTINGNSRKKHCILENVEVKLSTVFASRHMLTNFLRGYKRVMPCFPPLHVVVPLADENPMKTFLTGIDVPNIRVHGEKPPRYVTTRMSQWSDFWSDKYIMSPNTRFVMMFDTDTLPIFPFTCRGLFDNDGRPIIRYWTKFICHFNIVSNSILRATKLGQNSTLSDEFNAMAYFPMTIPVQIFSLTRQLVMEAHNATDFDSIWDSLGDISQFDLFAKVGYLTKLINNQPCPPAHDLKNLSASFCAQSLILVEHISYPSQGFLNGNGVTLGDESPEFNAYSTSLDRYSRCFIESRRNDIEIRSPDCIPEDRLIDERLWTYPSSDIKHDNDKTIEWFFSPETRDKCFDPVIT